jgi:hypothetical protein
MRWQEKILLMLMIGIVVSVATAISSSNTKRQVTQPAQGRRQAQNEKLNEFINRFPIADPNEPEPSDPKIRLVRREKGAKYDKPHITVDDVSEVVVGSPHWAIALPAFPLQQSSVVVIGTVTGAQARLSNNKKGVYSEFTLRLDDVLKGERNKSLTPDSTITVDREGGRVKLPSGKIGIYFIEGQGMPVVGRRYVLFLSGKESSGFTIVTGYELREGKVSPLDIPGSGHPFTKYDGAEEQSFLGELQAAIANAL